MSRLEIVCLSLIALTGCKSGRPVAQDMTIVVDSALPAPVDGATGPCATNITGCVDQAAYVADLELVAKVRDPGSAHWKVVQDLCADRFTQLGYTVERHAYGTGTNVLGVKTGNARASERLVVGAHYDHIAGCAGADDNASGLAGLLEVARVLSKHQYEATLVVACWDEEERGLVGSKAYAQREKAAGTNLIGDITYDCIGYKSDAPNSQELPFGFDLLFPTQYMAVQQNQMRGDFVTLVADSSASALTVAYVTAAQALGLPNTAIELTADQKNNALFADLRRSDHASFWAIDVPSIFLTDTANFRNKNYHCMAGPDTVDRLDHAFTTKIIQATVAAADARLGRR